MITDEQVCIACAAYDGADVAHSQLAAMRKALEAYEQSKWFGIYESLPEIGLPVLVLALNADGTRSIKIDCYLNGEFEVVWNATHWQPLPTFEV